MIISIGMSEPAKRNKQQTKKMKEPDDLEVTSSLKFRWINFRETRMTWLL